MRGLLRPSTFALLWALGLRLSALLFAAPLPPDPLSWPAITRQTRPWTYWWWMGSAVDPTNLTRELQRYHDAGLGGVHIIPIYGAKGFEDKFIPYLSPKWMEMLRYTVTEAHRLDMGVDMTTGTGWCFGGPTVTDEEANALVVVKTFDVAPGGKIPATMDRRQIQALVAFSPEGKAVELTDKIRGDGSVDWSAGSHLPVDSPRQNEAEASIWRVYAISERPSGQKVKRAAPGGEGHMLNLIYPEAVSHYMRWFADAFAHYTGPKPRAMYQDSYEYRSDWSPVFFDAFEKRHGYRLQFELPALFGSGNAKKLTVDSRISFPSRSSRRSTINSSTSNSSDSDHVARVKCDYRETVSDIMAEESLPIWAKWSRGHGFLTRNEAHGSPGNLLDIYAVADIPETEMFYRDRSKLVSKFASSAAHVTGKNLAAAETGTWLKEHFTETLADMKYLVDDMFLAGINHIFYHGTCYSPDEAGWPGWHFYASYEMNPRNSIWRDVPALNEYAARCQAILQSGKSDNDILLYWPIYDFWQNPSGRLPQLTVHARDWFEGQAIGRAAERLWDRGFAFDYISDRQLRGVRTAKGQLETGGLDYQVVVVPACDLMPVGTLEKLLALAHAGATVIFESHLPKDVPGWGELGKRRARFKKLLEAVKVADSPTSLASGASSTVPHESPDPPPRVGGYREAQFGAGQVLVGDLEAALAAAKVEREPMCDHPGVSCVRRAFAGGRDYFIANRGERPLDGWVTLTTAAHSVVLLDPMTDRQGPGALRLDPEGRAQVYLQLRPGETMFARVFTAPLAPMAYSYSLPWFYLQSVGHPLEIKGDWQVRFIAGGPSLPAPFATTKLASWTDLGGEPAQAFAGTALYTVTFDAPPTLYDADITTQNSKIKTQNSAWLLDLGSVRQSARVRLNGQPLSILLTPPFQVMVGPLKPKGNRLEVEVTNVSANRIRELDRRGVRWKNFYDINFVGLDYRPFDAANWPLTDSGLLGPVTLSEVSAMRP